MAPNLVGRLHPTCCQSTPSSNHVAELRVIMVAIERHPLRLMRIRNATVDFASCTACVFAPLTAGASSVTEGARRRVLSSS